WLRPLNGSSIFAHNNGYFREDSMTHLRSGNASCFCSACNSAPSRRQFLCCAAATAATAATVIDASGKTASAQQPSGATAAGRPILIKGGATRQGRVPPSTFRKQCPVSIVDAKCSDSALHWHIDQFIEAKPARALAAAGLPAHAQPRIDTAVHPARPLERLKKTRAGPRHLLLEHEVRLRRGKVEALAQQHRARLHLYGRIGVALEDAG